VNWDLRAEASSSILFMAGSWKNLPLYFLASGTATSSFVRYSADLLSSFANPLSAVAVWMKFTERTFSRAMLALAGAV